MKNQQTFLATLAIMGLFAGIFGAPNLITNGITAVEAKPPPFTNKLQVYCHEAQRDTSSEPDEFCVGGETKKEALANCQQSERNLEEAGWTVTKECAYSDKIYTT